MSLRWTAAGRCRRPAWVCTPAGRMPCQGEALTSRTSSAAAKRLSPRLARPGDEQRLRTAPRPPSRRCAGAGAHSPPLCNRPTRLVRARVPLRSPFFNHSSRLARARRAGANRLPHHRWSAGENARHAKSRLARARENSVTTLARTGRRLRAANRSWRVNRRCAHRSAVWPFAM